MLSFPFLFSASSTKCPGFLSLFSGGYTKGMQLPCENAMHSLILGSLATALQSAHLMLCIWMHPEAPVWSLAEPGPFTFQTLSGSAPWFSFSILIITPEWSQVFINILTNSTKLRTWPRLSLYLQCLPKHLPPERYLQKKTKNKKTIQLMCLQLFKISQILAAYCNLVNSRVLKMSAWKINLFLHSSNIPTQLAANSLLSGFWMSPTVGPFNIRTIRSWLQTCFYVVNLLALSPWLLVFL